MLRTLILAKVGLLGNVPACTDSATKPWVEEAGVRVLDQPFVAHGNVATAGAVSPLAISLAWMIARLIGSPAAESAVDCVAAVGQKPNMWSVPRTVVQQHLPLLDSRVGHPNAIVSEKRRSPWIPWNRWAGARPGRRSSSRLSRPDCAPRRVFATQREIYHVQSQYGEALAQRERPTAARGGAASGSFPRSATGLPSKRPARRDNRSFTRWCRG